MGFRDVAAGAVVLIMLFSAVPLALSDGTDAVPTGNACDGVLIYEVASNFGSSNEGFSLKNYGPSTVDLKDYYLCDNGNTSSTHRFTITSSLSLAAGATVTFVKTKNSDWYCSAAALLYSFDEKGSAGSQFNLANSGDTLQLYSKSGTRLDTVIYGNVTEAEGWEGPSADLGYKNQGIQRTEPTDTDTYFDWTPIFEGYTHRSFADVATYSGASVTPFVFPDSKGKPIFEAIMSADTSVCISIYMLTSKEMISELAYLASQGVDVKVMLESKPLGYDHNYGDIKNIVDAGGSVCFIGGNGSESDRYSYVHNKYAIIDGDTVIVTSENWTAANLGASKGNRGWGAVVGSAGYAAYMKTYFDNDYGGNDILTFSGYEAAKGAVTSTTLPTHSQVVTYVNGLDYSASTYTADIRMYMSPDNTFRALQYYIDNATTRVYTEQMDIGESYMALTGVSPLTAMINAAQRNVDCRFLLAESTDAAKDLVGRLNGYKVKSALMTSNNYATMHNKGVIIDDAVWLSSVNWTENAFFNNRECGLYIMSADVANFFNSAYTVDWNHDYDPDNVNVIEPTDSNNKDSGMPVDEKTLTWGAIALVVLLIVLFILYKIFVPKKVQKAVRKATKSSKKKSSGSKKKGSKKR